MEEVKFAQTFEEYLDQYSFLDNQWAYTNGGKLITPEKVLTIWHYYARQFKYAYDYCGEDTHAFGHWCKKILKEAGVL